MPAFDESSPADWEVLFRAGRIGLGGRIRDLRTEAGVSLSDAAAGAGISYSYLSDIERGRRVPTLEVLLELASLFDLTVAEVLAGVYPWGSRTPPPQSLPPPDGRRRPHP